MYKKQFWFLSLPLVFILLLQLVTPVLASPGDLDLNFGTNGRVTTDFNGDYDSGHAVAIQSDGKIVVAGEVDFGGIDHDFGMARYTYDGGLDTTFNTDGKVTTDFGSYDEGTAIAIQPDGKVIVAGFSGTDFALARYNNDGSLDTSFGTDGKVTTDFGEYCVGNAVAIQSDGKIIVAGYVWVYVDGELNDHSDFALVRYNSDGSLDTSFGTNGKVTTDFNGGSEEGKTVAIQSDGKIVVGGGYGVFSLARYNSNGSLDTSFDTDGKVTTDFSGFGFEQCLAVAIQSDGKIVAVGEGNSVFTLARYNSNGGLDTSFDTDGKVTTDFGGSAHSRAVAIQPDGKIVVAGYTDDTGNPDFAVARYNSNGSLDTSFGTGGKETTDFNSNYDYGTAVAIQSDGKIVVAGSSDAGYTDSRDFALSRYIVGNAPTVSINPSSQTVAPGGTATIDVMLDATGYSLKGCLVTVSFNNSVMTTTPGQIAGHNCLGKFEIGPAIKDGNKVEYAMAATTAQPDIDCSIMTIEFDVDGTVVPGDYDFTITMAELRDQNNDLISPVTLLHGTVTIGHKGDFDGNGCIELYDFVEFAGAFGSCMGDPAYNPVADFDDDGCIGLYDFVEFAGIFGTCY